MVKRLAAFESVIVFGRSREHACVDVDSSKDRIVIANEVVFIAIGTIGTTKGLRRTQAAA